MEYQQISCSLFDRIESLAVSKRIVVINYISGDLENNSVKGYIKNIFSENKAEYLSINGINIRLDKINSIKEL